MMQFCFEKKKKCKKQIKSTNTEKNIIFIWGFFCLFIFMTEEYQLREEGLHILSYSHTLFWGVVKVQNYIIPLTTQLLVKQINKSGEVLI